MKNTLIKTSQEINQQELLGKVLQMCESLNIVYSIFDQIFDQIENQSK